MDGSFYQYVDINAKDPERLAQFAGLSEIKRSNATIRKPESGKRNWSMIAYLREGYLPFAFNDNEKSKERERFSSVIVGLFAFF